MTPERIKSRERFAEWLLEELYASYLDARKGKRGTVDEQRFETFLFENLIDLRDCIMDRTYYPSRGVAFIISKPVRREIFAAPFRDRIVHHFLYRQNAAWWDRRLIYDSYSCREGKGTLFGIKRLVHHIRSVSNNYTEDVYVVQGDLKGYFMSLPRKGLYERVTWGLDQQYKDGGILYETCKFLWKEVIFDDPTDGVRRKSSRRSWRKLSPDKSLFCQPPGQGIVIGNLSSQELSNIYLDQLDRFITMELGYKHYGRYVDDFYIVIKKEQLPQLKRDMELVRTFLVRIGLKMNEKKYHVRDFKKGVPFLGVVVYPNHIVPGKRILSNFYIATQRFTAGFLTEDSIISYMGYMKNIRGKKATARVFHKAGWKYKF